MSDKDLLVVIAEMLRRTDEQSDLIQETNNTLKQFMDVTIQQFRHQHRFNEEQMKFNQQQVQFNTVQVQFNRRQQAFNERFLKKLDLINSNLLKNVEILRTRKLV